MCRYVCKNPGCLLQGTLRCACMCCERAPLQRLRKSADLLCFACTHCTACCCLPWCLKLCQHRSGCLWQGTLAVATSCWTWMCVCCKRALQQRLHKSSDMLCLHTMQINAACKPGLIEQSVLPDLMQSRVEAIVLLMSCMVLMCCTERYAACKSKAIDCFH